MRKLLLTGFVVMTFMLYSFQQRHEGSVAVAVPAALKASSQSSGVALSSVSQATTGYKDGIYDGTAADAFYGYIKVRATITSGKITDVVFLQYPNDRSTSMMINHQAMPYLKQEAIQAQTAHVNTISGASDTSAAFVESLSSALAKAL